MGLRTILSAFIGVHRRLIMLLIFRREKNIYQPPMNLPWPPATQDNENGLDPE